MVPLSASSPNSVRLIDFATTRNMIVCSTRFQHIDIHKAASMSSDRSNRNQIDHIVIDETHISNVLDMLTFRGANMESQHFLVAAKVRIRISSSRAVPSSTQRRLDVKKLLSERTAESFSAQLSDKLRQLQSSADGIGELWANIFHSLGSSAEALVFF